MVVWYGTIVVGINLGYLILDFACTNNALQKPCWHDLCSKPVTWSSHSSASNRQETVRLTLVHNRLAWSCPGRGLVFCNVPHTNYGTDCQAHACPAARLGASRARNSVQLARSSLQQVELHHPFQELWPAPGTAALLQGGRTGHHWSCPWNSSPR